MSILGGRGGHPDDWASQHERARSRAAERLGSPLDDDEARWLDDHLASCSECSAVADEYAAERLALRALRDREPQPPRDMWARTSAAIEREARPRSLRPSRRGRSLLAPYAVLAGALVVAVVYGSLNSSQPPIDTATTTPGLAVASTAAAEGTLAGPTPLIVAPQDVAYISVEDGAYRVNTTRVDQVCPADATTCGTSEPNEVVDIGPLSSPATVFGSGDRPLVIVGDGSGGSTVIAFDPSPASPKPTPSPAASIEPGPTPTAHASASVASIEPSVAPTSSASPSVTASPLVTASPSDQAPTGAIEIAHDLDVVGSTAAYAPDGSAFAFTAVPVDRSHGPDIYLWTVGDAEARPITSDHRSVFGSWAGDAIVGSSVLTTESADAPAAFVLSDPGAAPVFRPETGLVWRPVVDPTGGSAVYWSGTVEATEDGTGWTTASGSLVIGRWGSGGDTSGGAQPTPPGDDQAEARAETTIAKGPIADWDVRWDESGERLAVWIADADDPSVGRLSLFIVDPFDGRIDLTNPPLADEPALAGFSLANGRLAWASPHGNSAKSSRVKILAWTEEGFGQVESAPGDFILVR